MVHLLIYFEILVFVIGLVSSFYFYYMYKEGKDLLVKSVFIYSIFANFVIIGNFWNTYRFANISLTDSSIIAFLPVISGIGLFIFWPSLLCFFYLLTIRLIEKKINSTFLKLFIVTFLAIVVLHLWGIINYNYTSELIHFCHRCIVKLFSMFLIIILLIYSYFRNRSCEKEDKRISNNMFIILFLLGYIMQLSLSIFTWTNRIALPLTGLYLNLALLYWFKEYYLKNVVTISPESNKELVSLFGEKFAISNREQEVLSLILEGKNNREIEETLFISYNTIRNHVSALYKKIGVRSRGQLMNLVLKMQKRGS